VLSGRLRERTRVADVRWAAWSLARAHAAPCGSRSRSRSRPQVTAKAFCAHCGGHLWSGDADARVLGVRLGALDGDPGIRPQWHQWLESAPDWEPIPDDGLPRFARSRHEAPGGVDELRPEVGWGH
jgi:hypothetical protein